MEGLYDPLPHFVHPPDAPLLEYSPLGQGSQEVAPLAYFPAVHCVHFAFLLEEETLPAGHTPHWLLEAT